MLAYIRLLYDVGARKARGHETERLEERLGACGLAKSVRILDDIKAYSGARTAPTCCRRAPKGKASSFNALSNWKKR